MKYLAIAFAGEGATDYRFSSPLVERHVETLLAERATESIEVGAIIPVLGERGRPTNQRELVARPFVDGHLFADILFVHTDAGSAVTDAVDTRVQPLRSMLREVANGPDVVGVVPDREIEAWMLADIAAVERTLGVVPGTIEFSVPPRLVHTLPDPKASLQELVDSIDLRSTRRRPARRHTQRIDRVYSGLAGEISFERLREVPSFARYEDELVTVLQAKGFLE